MTGDEYMALLLERQAEHVAANPPARPWIKPLLESFIRPGDEALFTPPEETPQPKRETTPRVYRSAASLRAERDRLVARTKPLLEPIATDTAATHGAALGRRRTDRLAAREDSKLRKYVELDKRIKALEGRIARAERREGKR